MAVPLVDSGLRNLVESNDVVHVAVFGVGAMGEAIIAQIEHFTPGVHVAAVCNRSVARAQEVLESCLPGTTIVEIDDSRETWECSPEVTLVTSDPCACVEVAGISLIVEATGAIGYGARVALAAFDAGLHVLAFNAELDGTLGPLLRQRADAAGVLFSNSDGDQPGVIMNLWRWVRQLGMRPVLAGNIKGFHRLHRNPDTQKSFAEAAGQSPEMATSFCDGTKVNFEMAVVANATGMAVPPGGMEGPPLDGHIDDALALPWGGVPAPTHLQGHPTGIVEYVVMTRGNKPAPGVFVIAEQIASDVPRVDARRQALLEYYKMGQGPLYSFYTPYHLCHFEVGVSIARMVCHGDLPCAPRPGVGPSCAVVAHAKKPLEGGDVLDGIGGYCLYGVAYPIAEVRQGHWLPIGLAEGCVVAQGVRLGIDQHVCLEDIVRPSADTDTAEARDRLLAWELWEAQETMPSADV